MISGTPPALENKEEGKDKNEADPAVPVHLMTFEARDLALSYMNEAVAGTPFHSKILNLQIDADHLIYDPSRSMERVLPGTLLVTAQYAQEPPSVNAPILLFAKAGILSNDIPPVNAAVRIAGLDLRPRGGPLPPDTDKIIGSSGLDFAVNLALSKAFLDCDLSVTPAGKKPLPLQVGGTPASPEFDRSSILFPILLRSGGVLGGTVRNLSGVGTELVGATANTAKAATKGVLSVVSSAVKGSFRTLKGALTADVSEVSGGLGDTTVGTFQTAARGVKDTGSELKGSAQSAGSASRGGRVIDKWRAETPMRWEQQREKAMARVEKMPYPAPPSQ